MDPMKKKKHQSCIMWNVFSFELVIDNYYFIEACKEYIQAKVSKTGISNFAITAKNFLVSYYS